MRTSSTPRNVVVIMSDEHNPKIMGCAGHPIISTPNLDALAARGTRFTSAYTTSPVCVPARAAFALGKMDAWGLNNESMTLYCDAKGCKGK